MAWTAMRTLVLCLAGSSEHSLVGRGSGPGWCRLDGTIGWKQPQRMERHRRRQLDRG